MKSLTYTKLSFMMFLEFFIWGGWFVTLGAFMGNNLNASGADTAMAYSTQSWGAIVAPFIIGLIADRYFNAEKILGVLHLIGAALMYIMSQATTFDSFYPYVLGYMIAYMPTLALVNSVAFNQMNDPSKQFPLVRVFGTIGWIAAGWIISLAFKWDAIENIEQGMLSNTFTMVAIASLILGLFSFMLPKTPPSNKNEKVTISDILGLDALKLLKDRNFLVFFISSVLICIPLAFYYQNISPYLTELKVENSTAWASMGQMSEVVFMLLLPFFFKKYGFKKTILFGMLAWGIRYLLFAYGNSGDLFFMIAVGIALHGICYDFFFVSGQIYTDSKAGEKVKSAAQGLITLATYGVGMLVGFWVAGQIVDQNILTENGAHNWQSIWTFPAIFAVVVLFIFAILFKNENVEYKA
ncbi:nucleoside transporter [Tenacibaculum sp. MAR_2009_124]|uniref:nucleoside permease n=1 Tax=Tenacibaculum sp. MAR_2009_124 TaxID=1250059 RepID=UPI00089C16D8|nr:nucleoside permease [Tenacibaculum sp. MAR_2009_124]SEB36328.1 nucleoside transporter [Tenacibaculum sp. MAR_2009_124]